MELKKILKIIYSYLIKNKKKSLILFIFFSIIGAILEILSFSSIIPLTSFIIKDSNLWINEYFDLKKIVSFNTQEEYLFFGISLFVLIFFIRTLFLSFLSWYQNKFIYRLQEEVCDKIYKNCIDASLLWHVKNNTSKIIQTIVSEVNIFSLSVGWFLFLITDLIILATIAFCLIFVNAKLTILLVFTFLLYFLILQKFFKKKLFEWGVNRQYFEEKRIQSLQESFLGILNTKIYSKKEQLLKSFKDLTKNSLIYAFYVSAYQNILKLFFEFFVVFSIFVLVFAGFYILNFKANEISQLLGIYVIVSLRLLPVTSRLLASIQNLNYGKRSIFITKKYLNLGIVKKINRKKYKFKTNIEFRNIEFDYDTQKIFHNLNIKIQKKDFLGIHGPSGCGKTTFLKLLTSLLSPQKGFIFIDKKKLLENSYDWISQIGYVPQKVYLNDQTVEENIVYNNKLNLNYKDKLNNVLSKSGLDVDMLKKNVGENGSKLSGGQIQRVGIARALFREPSILIVDEPTNGLDKKNIENLHKTFRIINKTIPILMVSHEINFLKKSCNKIYEVVSGKLKKIQRC